MNRNEKIRIHDMFNRLESLGMSYDEADSLRRISMTLVRWFEAECNGEIQRDEADGKPYRYVNPGMSERRYKIADRESGAIRRLEKIMAGHPGLWHYIQGDPRGASLYVGKVSDLPAGSRIDSVYPSFGIAVY